MPLKRIADYTTAYAEGTKTFAVFKRRIAANIAHSAAKQGVPFSFSMTRSNRGSSFKDDGMYVFVVDCIKSPASMENMDAIVYSHTHSSEAV